MHFVLKIKDGGDVIKGENCCIDENGQLQITNGEESYQMVLRNFYKTYIDRNLKKEPDNKNKSEGVNGKSYFDGDFEYVE